MAALDRMLSRGVIIFDEREILSQIALLCAAGLLVSLLMLIDGFDLGPGFF